MVMDCYYFSPAYVFVKEDCPPKKPHTTRDGAKEYMVRFHPHDFEFVSHSLLFKKDEWISIDYIVYRHRESDALYVERIRNRRLDDGSYDKMENVFRVDGIDALMHMVCSDGGGYFEGEMEEALRELGHEPGTRRVGADELYDALIETMRAGRLIEVPPGMPDEFYRKLPKTIREFKSRGGEDAEHEESEDPPKGPEGPR